MITQYCFMFIVSIWALIGAKNYLMMVRKHNSITVMDVIYSLPIGLCCGVFAKRIFSDPQEQLTSKHTVHYSSVYDQEYESSTMYGGVVGSSLKKNYD